MLTAYSLILPFFVAFAVSFVALILLKPLAIRLGLVDEPGGRKQHAGHVPLIGGIAMFMGLGFSLLTLNVSLSHHRSLIACCALLVFTGLLDDFHELTPRSRLLVQILVGLLMSLWGGVILKTLGNLFGLGPVNLGYFAIPVSVLAVVLLINAVNMTDGNDGLAASLGVIEFSYLAWLCYHNHLFINLQIICLILATLFAFLCFNFPWREKASVFMGDSGSMMLGFLLTWFCISLSQVSEPIVRPVTFLWIMAVPLWDISSVVRRRLTKGDSPFKADRGHLHHYLLRCDFSRLQVTIMISILSAICGFIGILGELYLVPEYYMFLGFVFAFVLYIYFLHRGWKKIKG